MTVAELRELLRVADDFLAMVGDDSDLDVPLAVTETLEIVARHFAQRHTPAELGTLLEEMHEGLVRGWVCACPQDFREYFERRNAL